LKIYEIVVTFLDPARGVVQIAAESEEDAVNTLRSRLDGQVVDLNIESISLVVDEPEMKIEDLSADRTVN